MASVRRWVALYGWEHRIYGDEILNRVPSWYQERAGHRKQVITDLARLIVARENLEACAEMVIWVDADVFVFNPEALRVDIEGDYAFAREL